MCINPSPKKEVLTSKNVLTPKYVLNSWVVSCLQGFRAAGWDEKAIFNHAGLQANFFEGMYCDALEASKIFDSAIHLYGKDAGLVSRMGLVPNTFQSLSLAVLSAPSAAYGLNLMAEFSAYISNAVGYRFCADDKNAEFSFDLDLDVDSAPQILDAMASATLRTLKFITPKSLPLIEVHFKIDKPVNFEKHYAYFKVPVVWGAKNNALLMHSEPLFEPSIHHSQSMLESQLKLCQESMESKSEGESAYTDIVREKIKVALLDGHCSIDAIARSLNISVRSLQRRLSDTDSSFSALLEDVRKNEAIQMLESSSLNIACIAHKLGFNDSGNFTRAFKRWNNCSPELYRRRIMN